MKTIEVNIKLTFSKNGPGADIKTNGVPHSLIVESLNNLSKGLCGKLVMEAYGDVNEDQVADYLQGMLNLDRIKLKEMLK